MCCTGTLPGQTAEPAPAGDKRPLVRYERAGKTVTGRLGEVTDGALMVGNTPCWTYGKFNLECIG